MPTDQRRLDLYVRLESLGAALKPMRDTGAAMRYTLRAAREFFRADAGCAAWLPHGEPAARVTFSLPAGAPWDEALLAAFIRETHPRVPGGFLLAPVRRRGRSWGALALSRSAPFQKGDGRALCKLAVALTEAIERIDRERIIDVRSRIDRKIMEELRPKDLLYQILHGLRSLTRYDHSSALLILDAAEPALRLEAEQIAWHKGKSARIGARVALSPEGLALLARGEIFGFDRVEGRWRAWLGAEPEALSPLLDGPAGAVEPGAPAGAVLLAALVARGTAIGALRIASRHPRSFGPYEAELLDGFRSEAAIAIHNVHRSLSLQERILEAERKHAMADLARGVSHDVNNALGSALPLVQQMLSDLKEGRLDAAELVQDLAQVQESLQLCRRIFGGMLAFARHAGQGPSGIDLARAVRGTLAILQDGLDRRGVRVVLEVPEGLPALAGGQSDIERILFNLINNAREAMPSGGRLSVRARSHGSGVEIVVEDTGHGIPPADLPRIQEPFFTTKAEGSGLGLSICRSLVWQMNGDMAIESEVGRGTRVRLLIPRARPGRSAEEGA
ncbi:MAG TPA: HAMP domain-containing sensor histidine kinase [Candidatus Polarisedimenticolia bacterium]|nr:HAMP domain-containing sensor histidine kinase [Candidatus Polarisedimenticolia bacterium]